MDVSVFDKSLNIQSFKFKKGEWRESGRYKLVKYYVEKKGRKWRSIVGAKFTVPNSHKFPQ